MASKIASQKAAAKKKATANPDKPPKADTSGDGIPDAYDRPLPRALDARPDRFDFRDLYYAPPLRSLPPTVPSDADMKRFLAGYVKAGLILNQGQEGACTGFGLACVANYLLFRRHLELGGTGKIESVSPRMFYALAKHYDEWPGQDYEGSSCRGALKGWHKHGVCANSRWPYPLDKNGKPKFVRPGKGWALDATRRPLGVYYRVNKLSVVDIQAAINEIGAVYVSATVHDGWDELMNAKALPAPKSHAELKVIPPVKDPSQNGGHAFALVGYNDRGFIVQNSWGPIWGHSGFGILPYDDWAQNGTDCWAVALGVPEDVKSLRLANRARHEAGFTASRSLGQTAGRTASAHNPADDPWPFDRVFNFAAYQPWPTPVAYQHSLVSGNDGQMMVTDFTRDRSEAAGLAHEIVVERPLAWAQARKLKTLKVALYCHGGLNNESASIKRIRVLGPCFEANDIYPLFITWKTGPAETLLDMLQDWERRVTGEGEAASRGLLDKVSEALGEAKDRAIEATGRVLGRGIWSEMRENAERGAETGHVLHQMATQLRTLRAALKSLGLKLELHLVGHSAGSILIGHLLDRLGGVDIKVDSCELWAAACSVDFANRHYLPAAEAGVLPLDRLHLAVLNDRNERADGLPSPDKAAYGKSLLYLVSRALDDVRKQPLLGMERSLLRSFTTPSDQWDGGQLAAVKTWQAAWGTLDAGHPRATVVATPQVTTNREQGQSPATHGSFDNNLPLITALVERIRGAGVVAPLEWLDY